MFFPGPFYHFGILHNPLIRLIDAVERPPTIRVVCGAFGRNLSMVLYTATAINPFSQGSRPLQDTAPPFDQGCPSDPTSSTPRRIVRYSIILPCWGTHEVLPLSNKTSRTKKREIVIAIRQPILTIGCGSYQDLRRKRRKRPAAAATRTTWHTMSQQFPCNGAHGVDHFPHTVYIFFTFSATPLKVLIIQIDTHSRQYYCDKPIL